MKKKWFLLKFLICWQASYFLISEISAIEIQHDVVSCFLKKEKDPSKIETNISFCRLTVASRMYVNDLISPTEKTSLFDEVEKSQKRSKKIRSETLQRIKVLSFFDDDMKIVLASIYNSGIGEHNAGSDETYREEVKWLESAIEKGRPEALTMLGVNYVHGQGVPEDKKKAAHYFKQAADKGDKQAAKFLMILETQAAKENRTKVSTETLLRIKSLATSDDDMKMVLASIYDDEISDSSNHNESRQEEIRWLDAAAKNGRPDAMVNLGVNYVHGQGVPEDKKKAAHYFKQAADKGDKQAAKFLMILETQAAKENRTKVSTETLLRIKSLATSDDDMKIVLASIYNSGIGEHNAGSDETYREEVKWLESAIEKGRPEALTMLGVNYVHGQGVPEDKKKAAHYFKQAADKGDKQAAKFLMILETQAAKENRTKVSTETLLRIKSLATSDDDMKMVLASIYNSGIGEYDAGSDETYREEVKWLESAIEKGRPEALAMLGVNYVHGRGVPEDKKKAAHYFKQAADKGDKQAAKFLMILQASENDEIRRFVLETQAAKENRTKVGTETLLRIKSLATSNDDMKMVLASIYNSGIGEYDAGSDETYREEVKWLESAIEKGRPEALAMLGVNYVHGRGVPEDKKKAAHYFKQAADKGDKQAAKFLMILQASE